MAVTTFLQHLKETASSPYAFVAYICVVGAWVYVVIARHRLRTVARMINALPEDRRAEIILRDYSTTPRSGLSAEQWIRTRRHTLFLISFLGTLITAVAIVGITFSRGGHGLDSNKNESEKNHNTQSDTEIAPLVDPVDVTSPSPTPPAKDKNKSTNDPRHRIPPSSVRPVSNLSLPLNGTSSESSPSEPARSAVAATNLLLHNESTDPQSSRSKAKSKPLEVVQILEGRSGSENIRIFDVTLANKSNVQKLLKTFDVSWSYVSGGGANNVEPHIIKPKAKYIIEIPIDLNHPEDEKNQLVYPPLLVPPGSDSEPNLLVIRLHVYYSIERHPYSNWELRFSIRIVDNTGDRVDIFSKRSWSDRAHKE